MFMEGSDVSCLDIMAFGAHPDDMELLCGGTLIKMANKGYKVGICDLTRGSLGVGISWEGRRLEASVAAEKMDLAVRENCDIPDGGVFVTEEGRLKLVEMLRRHRPKVVVTFGEEALHPDHRNTRALVLDASFLASVPHYGKGDPHSISRFLGAHLPFTKTPPSFVVDVTEFFPRKLESVFCHKTQFPDNEKWEGYLVSSAISFGAMIGARYGEGFTQREVVEIDDIVQTRGYGVVL